MAHQVAAVTWTGGPTTSNGTAVAIHVPVATATATATAAATAATVTTATFTLDGVQGRAVCGQWRGVAVMDDCVQRLSQVVGDTARVSRSRRLVGAGAVSTTGVYQGCQRRS